MAISGYSPTTRATAATASCDSKITYIDGDVGVLLYRGYPIEQLAEKSNFLEVCYLLLNGELPDEEQLKEFELGVMRHTMLHEQLRTSIMGSAATRTRWR